MKDYIITICNGTTCINKGVSGLQQTLEEQLQKTGLTDRVKINISGCLGMCEKGPIMVIYPGYTIYGNLKNTHISEIVEQHLVNNKPVANLAIQEDRLFNRFFRIFGDTEFFGKQLRIALRNC